MTLSCWLDTHPQAAIWDPATHPEWYVTLWLDQQTGGELCGDIVDARELTWVPGAGPGGESLYCADLGLRVPWCTPYSAQWMRDAPGDGPIQHVRWLPEPSWLGAGLILLVLIGRRRAAPTRPRRQSES